MIGTNAKGQPLFGDYQWETYRQVNEDVENLANGMTALKLAPEVDGEDRKWRFVGIWSKNRAEWAKTLLSCMHYNMTTVGFYDAMGVSQVEYILNQTEMATIFGTADYAKKILDMQETGKASKIKNLVIIGATAIDAELTAKAEARGTTLYKFEDVITVGKSNTSSPRTTPKPSDIYVLSYTSGTTGDSKGVKLSHANLMAAAKAGAKNTDLQAGESVISYLPFTHSFEQGLFSFSLYRGLKIGFYQGNPLKLVEDCAALKPVIFPSVPRLYNKIYGALQARFDALTGCKRWLLNRGLAAKQANLETTGAVRHGCYDTLLFGKAASMLGG